jgi:c-di-GMP-binding flagellar brake protein YcgR
VLEGEVAHVTIEVRRAGFERDRGRYRMGLEFIALGAETRELIERLVAPPADAPAV